MSEQDVIKLIKEYRLLVRPSLLHSRWIVGKFLGVTGDGKAYTVVGMDVEDDSLEKAILKCVSKINSYS